MKLKVPMSHSDATALDHVIDTRIASMAVGVGQPGNYGEAKRWMADLFEGKEIEVPDAEMEHSRKIINQAWGPGAS